MTEFYQKIQDLVKSQKTIMATIVKAKDESHLGEKALVTRPVH